MCETTGVSPNGRTGRAMPEYHATKYDSAADEVIAELADEATGYGRASTGNVDCCGWHGLVILDDSCDLDFSDHTNYPTGDYVGELAREYGVTAADVLGAYVVTHNDQGFVYVVKYDSEPAAVAAFGELESAHAEHDSELGSAVVGLLVAFPALVILAYIIGAVIGIARVTS